MVMPIADRDLTRAGRDQLGPDHRDEVWDGEYVVSPFANNQHRRIVARLLKILARVVDEARLGESFATVNVSDRAAGWTHNVREPDLAVFLTGNPAIDHGTHWQGGPDLVVEVLSPGDPARRKRAFYAGVGVREFLIIDRDPWSLEQYRLADGELIPAGTATVENGATLASAVLPLTFRLVAGGDRPAIEIARNGGDGDSWTI